MDGTAERVDAEEDSNGSAKQDRLNECDSVLVHLASFAGCGWDRLTDRSLGA